MKKQSNLSRLLALAGGHKKLTFLGCALSGIAAVLGLVPYVCVWLAAKDVLAAYPDVTGAFRIVRWGWMAVWFAIANILVYFAALMCTHIAAFRTARNMRHLGTAHILELPLGFFTGNQSGRLRKIIDDNAALTEDLLAHKLADLTAAVVTPIAAVVLLFTFDWRMGLLCLLTMILAFVCMASMMGGKNAGFFHRYQREIEKMSAEAVEYVRGIPVVKVFQQTVYSFKAFYTAIQSYSDLASQYAMSCRNGQTSFLTCINGGFALLIPAALLLASGGDGWEVLADFIFYALFAPACGAMINRIMYASESVMEANEAMMKLDQILEQKPLEETASPKKPENETVTFEHVTFQYPGTEHPALKDVSFTIEPGQKVAFVGATGAGKSSILNLIGRYYDIQKGQILIDGVDIKELNTDQLRGAIGQVQQDVFIFTGDIKSNIRLRSETITDEQVVAAARYVNADHFIEQLNRTYEEAVTERGSTLSAGQRQLLSFARTLAYDPAILVMDEATANIDTETEQLIQEALEKLMRGRTTIMVAHRLSTIQHADKIMVMHKGEIRESGTHQELLAINGIYKKLYELQLD